MEGVICVCVGGGGVMCVLYVWGRKSWNGGVVCVCVWGGGGWSGGGVMCVCVWRRGGGGDMHVC